MSGWLNCQELYTELLEKEEVLKPCASGRLFSAVQFLSQFSVCTSLKPLSTFLESSFNRTNCSDNRKLMLMFSQYFPILPSEHFPAATRNPCLFFYLHVNASIYILNTCGCSLHFCLPQSNFSSAKLPQYSFCLSENSLSLLLDRFSLVSFFLVLKWS